MNRNRVFKWQNFDKYAKKILSTSELRELDKFISDLKLNSNLGKPLVSDFLREKKLGNKRVYFLVYDELCMVLLVASSNKKTQQETIDGIKLYLDEYKKYMYDLYDKLN